MSREDRRPLSQVPEDSVNTYMHPFASYAPNQHESFTLHPPYNPTDQNIFDTFAYSSSDAVPYLSTPNWEYYHTAVQDVSDTGTEYPYLSSLQFPDLPLHTPVPRPAQPSLLLPDPSPANVALSYSPEGPTPFCDLNTILNSTDLFAGLFPDVEYCDFPVPVPVPVPQPAPTGVAPQMLALNMTESYSGASLSPRRSRVARVHPTLGISGFSPSDPDDLSSHEKKRLYVECLEHYVQYLHQLLAYLNVPPIPLERVSSYRGLTSRSMRTILLTLGRSADMIHALTVEEANKSMYLRDALFQAQAVNYAPIYENRSAPLSPSSESAATSSTCVTADPEAADISKYFADPSF